jgi:hypothetical protein
LVDKCLQNGGCGGTIRAALLGNIGITTATTPAVAAGI